MYLYSQGLGFNLVEIGLFDSLRAGLRVSMYNKWKNLSILHPSASLV